LQQTVSSSNLPLKCDNMNSMTLLLFRNFVNGPMTVCKDSLANFFNIFISSACGRVDTMWLVFNRLHLFLNN
jgi:hypothetical protein